MPVVVWILGCAIFVQGTSEMMIAGLLPGVAADLGVSIPDAGLLISAFACGMAVGAPTLAVLVRRRPARVVLPVLLALFAIGHVAGALAPGATSLLVTRAVSGFVYAGFWAVAAATAVHAAGPAARGRAMSVVAGGLTLSIVVGLPAGTVLGQSYGWRAAFWAVAAASALATVAVAATVRDTGTAGGGAPLGAGLRAVTRPPLLRAYATTALATGALLAVYGYLAPMTTEAIGLPAGAIPAVLGLYGVGALAGVVLGGRAADAAPTTTVVGGAVLLAVVSGALALTATTTPVALVLVGALGLVGFGTNPALQARVFGLAGDAATLAAAGNVTAFNVGIALGPWLGGRVLAAGHPVADVAWVGAVLALAAAALAVPLPRRPATARDDRVSAGTR